MQKIGDITNTADGHGEFTNGNVAAGIPPTLLEAEWFNTVQREMINVLLKAGMQPNKTNDAQLSEAIGKLVSDSKVPLTDSLGQSSALATSQKLVNQVNDNANSRLEKAQNGADIPNKPEFVNHLGLTKTVELAANALDKRTGGTVSGDIAAQGSISSQGNLSILKNASVKGQMTADERVIVGTEAQNAILTPWGDLRGSEWGGWLSHWLNASFARKNSGVFSGKGWFKDESTGLIIQWGTESVSNRHFNFPHMFAEACFVVLVTNSTSQGERIDNAFGYPVNNSEFYAATKREDGLVNDFPVAWLAIGR